MLSLTPEQIKIIQKAIPSHKYFVNNIFNQSFEKFIGGEHVDWTADFLQNNLQTSRVSARDHFKSTSLYSFFMWELLNKSDSRVDREYHYFSHTSKLAAYHISKIKSAIRINPFFVDLVDMKTQAEGVIKYRWKGSEVAFTIEPQGMLEFKRGLHCNGGVFVDDPFQDPASKLDPKIITRINDIMKTQIMAIPNETAFLHIAGTAQTKEDFFFDKDFLGRFQSATLPAIKDAKNQIVLWPEWMGWDELMARKKEIGERIFNQEYLCVPFYAANVFFTEDQILEMMFNIPNVPFNNGRDPKGNDIIAGWDLGKHRHPAHFSVFEIVGDKDEGEWIQLHQHFFDGEDYKDQLEYIELAIDKLEIDRVYYDATRGEIEVVAEKGDLPKEFMGVNLGLKKKNALATEFDKKRTNKKIKLITDERQKRSIMSVLNDLKAIETPEGHGDAFFSICLSLNYLTEPKIGVY